MPHLPESARLWLERADIDYIGPFVKAWAAFNAWFRHASDMRRDLDGLSYVKNQPNPVGTPSCRIFRRSRYATRTVIFSPTPGGAKVQIAGQGLHVCLDSFHIEITRDDAIERISFRSVSSAVAPPAAVMRVYGLHYRVEKANGLSAQCGVFGGKPQQYSGDHRTPELRRRCVRTRSCSSMGLFLPLNGANLLALYQRCNPRPMTDLMSGAGGPIRAGDVEFRCADTQLFRRTDRDHLRDAQRPSAW